MQNLQYASMGYLKRSNFHNPAEHCTEGKQCKQYLHQTAVYNKHCCLRKRLLAAPVVYPEAAVLDGAVHGELPCALLDPPLHHFTIASQISHLESIHIVIYKRVSDIS